VKNASHWHDRETGAQRESVGDTYPGAVVFVAAERCGSLRVHGAGGNAPAGDRARPQGVCGERWGRVDRRFRAPQPPGCGSYPGLSPCPRRCGTSPSGGVWGGTGPFTQLFATKRDTLAYGSPEEALGVLRRFAVPRRDPVRLRRWLPSTRVCAILRSDGGCRIMPGVRCRAIQWGVGVSRMPTN
jgi:hypothetical protein